MRHITATARLAAFAALCALSHLAAAASLEEALDSYVEGLRVGDVRTLEQLFFADGQFCSGGAGKIRCSRFADVLPSWVERPDSKARGKVIAKDFVGETMANVTYELEFNGDSYVDYLLLYKTEGRWLVVAKTTFIRP